MAEDGLVAGSREDPLELAAHQSGTENSNAPLNLAIVVRSASLRSELAVPVGGGHSAIRWTKFPIGIGQCMSARPSKS